MEIRPKPVKIDREYFRARYGDNFPDLLSQEKNAFLDACINDVYTLFWGVSDIWARQPSPVYEAKTHMCYGLLLAWYIADLYPDYSLGVVSTGGIPLKGKSIGGVKLQFDGLGSKTGSANNADLLQSLKSNAYGVKAYTMIKTSGKLNFFLSVGR